MSAQTAELCVHVTVGTYVCVHVHNTCTHTHNVHLCIHMYLHMHTVCTFVMEESAILPLWSMKMSLS